MNARMALKFWTAPRCGFYSAGMAVFNRQPMRFPTLEWPWQPPPTTVNLQTASFDRRFAAAPELRKEGKALVRARCATRREFVETRLKDGQKETDNWAETGDWIVTNPGGEQLVVRPETFHERYVPTPDPEVFKPVGISRIVPNLSGLPVRVMPPWGREQFGAPDCLFAMAVGPGGGLTANRYIIGVDELAETYEKPPGDRWLHLRPQARLHWLNPGESVLKAAINSPPRPNPGRRGNFPAVHGPQPMLTTLNWPKGSVRRT